MEDFMDSRAISMATAATTGPEVQTRVQRRNLCGPHNWREKSARHETDYMAYTKTEYGIH